MQYGKQYHGKFEKVSKVMANLKNVQYGKQTPTFFFLSPSSETKSAKLNR